MIVVVDYNMGNLGSIGNMLRKIGVEATVSADGEVIAGASKLILPGVGAFDAGVENLRKSGLIDVLTRKALVERVPVLGVCLGMQLMTKSSEEGVQPGLGWVDAGVVRLAPTARLKVPHMGWDAVSVVKQHPVLHHMPEEARFYFVHSYHVRCQRQDDILLTACYGNEFVAAYQNENLIGVQFHPEKSHKFGMGLLQGFASLR